MIHLFEVLAWPGLDDCLRGVKGDVAFLLGLADQGDSIDSYSPQWYAHGPDDNDNTGSGCASQGPQPFFPAI